MIEDKSDFNTFANKVRALFAERNYDIKISKLREILALAAGFNSHNHLLSRLPIDENKWLEVDVSSAFEALIKQRHSIDIDGTSVLRASMEAIPPKKQKSAKRIAKNPFVPESLLDFKNYAACLAWLIEEEESKGEDLLMRIYGYQTISDLKKAIDETSLKGPYDSKALVLNEDGHIVENKEVDSLERSNLPLELVAEIKKCTLSDLPSRYWKVRDLGLFDEPDKQRASFQLIRDKIDAIAGQLSGKNRITSEYAYVTDSSEGETFFSFTPLGKAIYEAALEVLPPRSKWLNESDYYETFEQLEELEREHPNNPWPKAILISWCSQYNYQGDWTTNLQHDRENGYNLDVDLGFRNNAHLNALDWIDTATETISQFESLLGDHAKNTADHKLYCENGDAFYWPAALFFGGMIALNAGELKLAKKWLSLNFKLTSGDNFGAR